LREVITHADQATPEWLTAVLYQNGCLPQGHVVAVHRKPSSPGFSTIVPLELSYSDDAPASAPARLVLKLAGAGDLSTGKEEVEFYTRIAAAMSDPPVVHCYDAIYSEKNGRAHLLMEDLSETHVSHPPSMLPPPQAHAEQIVDALARIHAYWWDHPRLGRGVGVVPTATSLGTEMAENERRWRAFADLLGDRLSIERRGVYERVLASFLPVQLRRLAEGKDLTLIHDDPHSGNFLYPRDPGKHTLRIIDWKSWRIAAGASDMAHMMAVFWFPERRAWPEQDLLRRYHRRLLEGGVQAYSWESCWYDYRFAVIGYLFYPIWQWSTDHPDFIWWHHLERLMLAFQDLGCEELLDD
jgi:thiamine kinase-like enzyme